MENQTTVPRNIDYGSAPSSSSSAASASSSSTSLATSYSRYDVFLNHRGPDVKATFATDLYARLVRSGFQVFLDQPEMEKGHSITYQIQAAIEAACVHVAIFSPTYAESSWCLDELVLMVNSKATILPVFYNVEPYVLRWTVQNGVYAEALRKLAQKTTYDPETGKNKPRYDSQTIKDWRRALSLVADLSGFELEKG